MLVGVYLDPRRSSTTSKYAESGNYEAFVVVHYCQLQLIQPQILTNKQERETWELSLRKFRGWGGVLVIKDTLCFGFNELKVSTLYNNKGFINLHFLQKMNCQKTEWDQARFSSLV